MTTIITGKPGQPMPDPAKEPKKPARFPAPTTEEVVIKPTVKKEFRKITPPLVEFMTEFERYEPVGRDSTCIMAYKECPRKYFYVIVLGMRDKIQPAYFRFGTAYHAYREAMENKFIETANVVDAIKAGMEAGLKAFGDKDPSTADKKWSFLTKQRLVASMMYMSKVWKKEKKDGKIKVIAVEQPFEVVLADGATTRGGKADQFVKWNGMLYGRDFKTSSKSPGWYDRGINPNDQFTGYTLGLQKLSGQPVQGLIVDVLFNTKTTGPTTKQYIASRSQCVLRQWEKEQAVVEQNINNSRKQDTWPMHEKNCTFCIFRSVCKKGSELAQAGQLKAEFVQKAWDYKNITDD